VHAQLSRFLYNGVHAIASRNSLNQVNLQFGLDDWRRILYGRKQDFLFRDFRNAA
jgi:hypothetical protein